MVCKEEVLSWFKELESYRRIDVMCALLNMCLPFELRFLGTYLEELGKRDFQELRGAELRANNHQDLSAELAQELTAPSPHPPPSTSPSPSPSGAPATVPPRLRRKMALYVSLLRSCNYACAATLYQVMFGLERAGLPAGAELKELLLLYTMSLHHPAFTFDMHSHFDEMLDILKREERRDRPPCQPCAPCPPTRVLGVLPPDVSVPPPPVGTVLYVEQPPQLAQGPTLNSEQMNEVVNPPLTMQNPGMTTSAEPIYPIMSDGVVPPPPGIPLQPYPMGEYVMSHPHWPGGILVTPINQTLELINYQVSSPIQSQLSSPSDSRSGSPTVRGVPPSIQQNVRSNRRPSQDTTPPPPHEHLIQHPHHIIPNFSNLKINERHPEDDKPRDLSEVQMKSLQTVELPNGLRRTSHSSKVPPYVPAPYRMQQSSGSDSGSSTGSHSPSETPALPAPVPPGPGRPRQPPSPQQYAYMHYPRSAYTTPYTTYRPSYAYPVNGEAPMYGGQQFAGYVHMPYAPPPKVSCWNCGAMGHSGSECKEPSIEEVTRSGGYQLDYSSAPPDMNDK